MKARHRGTAGLFLPFLVVLPKGTLRLPREPAVARTLLIGHELRFRWVGLW